MASILDRLACPICKSALEARIRSDEPGVAMDGFLECVVCGTATPVSHGFPLFTETQLNRPSLSEQWLNAQNANWFRAADYDAFLREKAARNLRDSYAFFQPFNESSRSLLALLEPLRESLKPGDLVLDTWCRTGWSGEWLASLFPEQQVVSLWEGNSNVLGYAGFQYWLPEGKRAANLSILFSHADRPLPFQSHCVQLVVGLDSLHRYRQDTFLAECMRVTREEGVLFFPHIHLTNSEPDPFFERGCLQLPGSEWEYILSHSCKDSSRNAFIFAEPELFDSGSSFTLKSDPVTRHYNGAALIGPKVWEGRTVSTCHQSVPGGKDRLLGNALIDVNLDRASVAICSDKPGLEVSELLLRHPIYQQRLDARMGCDLTEIECEVVFHSRTGKCFEQICDASERTERELSVAARSLCEREILFPAAVSRSMSQLQAYYGYLELPGPGFGSFPQLWATLSTRYAHQPIMLDEAGVRYDFESVDIMVGAASRWLQTVSDHGDAILICSENCPELFILVWACWLTGRVVVPIDVEANSVAVADIIERTRPVVCFSSRPLASPYYQFDSLADENSAGELFSDLLGPYVESTESLDYTGSQKDMAAILFTSGSTGTPKGVCLGQGSLLQSAQMLAQHFKWSDAGVLLSLGATHTMSGLRNPAVAALVGGMTVLVPAPGRINPLQIYGLLSEHDVTHLSTVPSLLASLEKFTCALAAEQHPRSLKQVVTTGYALPTATRIHIEQFLGVPVYSYYGLTETGGVCLADAIGNRAEGNLGFPTGAIAQVRDTDGRVLGPGQSGELFIYSPARA
ncbi:MAG: AMP-binding protein, partial [Halioglobus sp.]|nr:AMP-binding protein [Halioglobus sp.]